MKRIDFIKYLGALGLALSVPLRGKQDYSYGTDEYPVRTVLDEEPFRINSIAIMSKGKVLHKTPIRNFKIERGATLKIIWEIENK